LQVGRGVLGVLCGGFFFHLGNNQQVSTVHWLVEEQHRIMQAVMGELTRVVKPRIEALPTRDTEEAWGSASTTLKVRNHPHAPSNMMSPGRGSSMATKSEVVGDMMGELTRVLKQRGAAEATDTEDTAEAARAKAKAEAEAKAEAAMKTLTHIFTEKAATGALEQGEEEISPTQTIKGSPQTKSFESLPPPAARRTLDLSTTVREGQIGRQLGDYPKPAFLTELQQVLQKGAESEEGNNNNNNNNIHYNTTNRLATASAKAEGRAQPLVLMPAPAVGRQDLMGELTRVLKQRGAAEATAATAATTVTRRPSFGRKKRPGQGEAAAGEMPVAPHASSTPKPLPPAMAATAATASVVTRRLSFGRKTKTKEKQPSGQVQTAEPGAVPMAPDEPSTAEPPPPATTAAAAVSTASAKVHMIDAFLNHPQTRHAKASSVACHGNEASGVARHAKASGVACHGKASGVARHAKASCVARLAMIKEDNEQDGTEAVFVEPDESSATEPPPPAGVVSRAAARAAAAARNAAVAATASAVSRRPSFERKKRPAPLATKLTVEACRLKVELEGCLEEGLGLGLDASNRITKIKPAGQAAASRELLLGDVVVSVDGTALEGRQLRHVMRPGAALTLEVERGGGGFRRTRQLSFERKTAKQKRKEAETRKEAAEAEAEKVVEVMDAVSGGSDNGTNGGTPCATFAVAAAAAADLFATIAAATAELSTAAAASDDADEASANVPHRVPLSALSRARQYAAQHRQPAASEAATQTARRPHFLETRPGSPPTAQKVTLARRRLSFGRKKHLTGQGGTHVHAHVVTLEAPISGDDGFDEDLTV
jgi:hypothetical protein